MSRDLGIVSAIEGAYYFISYNSEDESRIAERVQALDRYNLPMWYDNGLKSGEEWETEIANRIEGCEAMILFLTKGIFEKESSYVYKEFIMATRYFGKKVLLVCLDKIERSDIPNKYLSFYIDLENLQSIDATQYSDLHSLADRVMSDLGFSPDPQKIMDQLKSKYESLDDERKMQLMGSYFEMWAERRDIIVRANTLLELYRRGALNLTSGAISKNWKLGIGLSIFKCDTRRLYTTSLGYDAELLHIYRDGQIIFTVYASLEPSVQLMYYDELSDSLFVIYSYVNKREAIMEREANNKGESFTASVDNAVIVIEHPTSTPKGCIVGGEG